MTGLGDRRGIACAGNWIFDTIHMLDRLPRESELVRMDAAATSIGGGAANVAFDLAALGVDYPVLPVGLIGADAEGEQVIADCLRHGLTTQFMRRKTDVRTAQTYVMTIPGRSRTFFYHGGANDAFDAGHVDASALAQRRIKILYLGYLNLLPALAEVSDAAVSKAAELLAEARASGLKTCIDLVSLDTPDLRRQVEVVLPSVDLLLANEMEASRASGVGIASEDDRRGLCEAADVLLDGGVCGAVVLHTPRLVLWKSREEELWTIPDAIPPAEIVSPVGAGDAFAAGVLHGLHEDWTPSETLRLALRAAAACLRGVGASEAMPKLDALVG